jgi:hypothetical protein
LGLGRRRRKRGGESWDEEEEGERGEGMVGRVVIY